MIKKSSNAAKQLNGNLQDIAWLLEDEEKGLAQPKPPNYGDVTELNTERTILDGVGQETLKMLAEDIMSLLDTSVAVYEKNGDYAYGSFVSEWCSLMDGASRELCNTSDNRKALNCGRWLCHENCWNDSAKAAIESGKITDIACVGGIRLYSVPIIAGGNCIGVINMGHGNPPTDEETQKDLSRTFGCDRDAMRKAAEAFNPRPPFLIDIAKKRLQSIAVQIGRTVEAVQNEEKLKDVARFPEENRNPVLRVDNEMRLLYANPAAMKLIVEPGTTVGDKIPAQWHSLVQEAWSKGEPMVAEVPLHGKVYSFSSNAISDQGYVNVYATDITERKWAEVALRNSEKLLSRSQEIANIGSWQLDLSVNRLIWTDEVYRIFGCEPQEFASTYKAFLDFVHPDDRAAVDEAYSRSMREGSDGYEIEHRIVRRNSGEIRYVHERCVHERDDTGAIIQSTGMVIDITEKKKTEQQREEGFALLTNLARLVPGVIYQYRLYPDGRSAFPYASPGMVDIYGVTPEEVREDATPVFGRLHPDDHDRVAEDIHRSARTLEPFYCDFRVILPGKGLCWRWSLAHPERTEDGGTLWHGIIMDVTERMLIENAIAAEKDRLSVTLRSIGDGVITTDTNGAIVLMNKVAEELTGWKQNEAEGKSLGSVFTIINESTREPHENPVHKVLSTGKVIELANHTLLISRDGTERIIADSGAPIKDKDGHTIGVVLVFRDMTEKQNFLEITQNSQKLESLGVLAGGIAHDFNNLLGGIFGYIDMASESAKDETVSLYLSKAMNTINRARALTQQLLTFAKGGAPVQKAEKVFPFVQETALFALSGSNVTGHFDIPKDIWPGNFDKNQIAQVIDNLVINAVQAMPMGGAIAVTARNITLAEKEHPGLAKGNYVRISIKDTGIGIPREMLPRIFDPFFTTKSKGHGLGLATCYSIMNRHGGCIDVDSDPGKGSVFHVYLTAADAASSFVDKQTSSQHKGSGTFIVMDDEEVMREVLEDMLKTLGYTVVCKNNGKDAVEYLAAETESKRPVSGMIFDLTVPGGMGGMEAVAKVRKIDSETPVFVASGYADGPVMKNPVEYGFTASICKPFRRTELMEMLEKHMNKGN